MKMISHPPLGALWLEQGGILGAIMRGAIVDGVAQPDWAVIVPTDPVAEIEAIAWGGQGKDAPGCASMHDGMANTVAMAAAGLDAAQRVRTLNIGERNDFYIAARDEMRALAMNVPELFSKEGWYWTSTQYSRYGAWFQYFECGYSYYYVKDFEYRVRAVRRFTLQPFAA